MPSEGFEPPTSAPKAEAISSFTTRAFVNNNKNNSFFQADIEKRQNLRDNKLNPKSK